MEKKLFSSFAGKFLKKHVSHGGEAPDGSHGMMLYLEGINKSFDGFKAINDLNLYIEKGELRCIIGPNGAGKSTMMDIITGKTRPDSGSAWFGQNINLLDLEGIAEALASLGRKVWTIAIAMCSTTMEKPFFQLTTAKAVIPFCLSESNMLKSMLTKDIPDRFAIASVSFITDTNMISL